MASVTWQGFSTFVQNAVVAVQAAAKTVIDATIGSVTLAYAQAQSGVALFLQGQAAQITALTRFATSYGADADSWGADFGFGRLGATYATSAETFSRYTDTQAALIPAGTGAGATLTGGAIVSTGPGGIQFMVTIDTSNPLWNAAQGGYLVPGGTASATVPIQCLTAGAAGNVLAGTITSFYQPLPGFDTCANAADITNGVNAEPDTAYKARFSIWLAGLASADQAAIESAIAGVQQGLTYSLVENYDYPGTTPDNGSFFVVINDGSGAPPSGLLTLVSNAINAVRAFTVRFQGAYAPSLVTPAIALNVRLASGYTLQGLQSALDAAIVTAVNGTPLDQLWLYVQAIEDAAKSVAGVVACQPGQTKINGSNADLALSAVQLPQITASNLTIGTY